MRRSIPALLAISLAFSLTACGVFDGGEQQPPPLEPEQYFPLAMGKSWLYATESGESLQAYRITSSRPGTPATWYLMSAIDPRTLSPMWSMYYAHVDNHVLAREPRTMRPAAEPAEPDTVLRSPIVVGDTWENSSDRREVLSVNETVTVPSGRFHNVVVVERTFGHGKAARNAVLGSERLYYAPNVGLVRREVLACIPCTWELVDWE